jgi:hypothetical protein
MQTSSDVVSYVVARLLSEVCKLSGVAPYRCDHFPSSGVRQSIAEKGSWYMRQ